MIEEKKTKNWHSLPKEEVLRLLQTNSSGLKKDEVQLRLKEYGPNELREKAKTPWIVKLLEQFKSPLIIVLLAAIVISAALGEYIDAGVILAIVIMNAILGLVQEGRAEQALEALKKMAVPKAQVLRDGQITEIPSPEIVPGDILILNTGNKIPADARLIKAFNLQVDEAPLTGESFPVEKEDTILPEDTPLAERKSMVFSGTTVTYGRGEAVVVATGMETEFGKIAELLEETKKEETPLQKSLDQVGKMIAFMVLAICVIVFIVGLLRGAELLFMLLLAISLAVAAIPEGLPAAVTIVLALGTQRMAQRGAIIRHLPAVETLGSTSVICSDKTGTMTLNEMTVEKIFTFYGEYEVTGIGYNPQGEILGLKENDSPEHLQLLLLAAALNTDATLVEENGRWTILGDPTEGALIVLAQKGGLLKEELLKTYDRIKEIPFTSERKMMTTLYRRDNSEEMAFSKGAPDVIIQHCAWYQKGAKKEPLDESIKRLVLEKNDELASQGLRLLGIAYRQVLSTDDPLEDELIFLGLAAMKDAPRKEVRESINICRQAGIKPVMITGDHLLTAVAVGSELGLIQNKSEAITAQELEHLSDEELLKKAPNLSIYARVSPEDKVRILTAYQKGGNVVAMTGDGVNDAPALKQADIGVAMGITGTDVSKEAADMILTDDNFATIVKAVEEGRTIFTNIKKFISFLLSCNIAEVLAVFAGFLLFPAREPILTPAQILWMNLVTDGLPALALGVDPPEKDVMLRPPRKKEKGIFTRSTFLSMGISAIIMGLGTILAFILGHQESVAKGETMAFTTIVVMELLYSYFSRSMKEPGWTSGFFSNKYLFWAILSSFLLQCLIIYLPPLRVAFSTTPLNLTDWGIVALISFGGMLILELIKFFFLGKIAD